MIRSDKELLDFFSKLSIPIAETTIKERKYSLGEKIITQEKHVSSIFIIKHGIVKCYVNEDNGRDFIQEFFSKGEILGELEVLNDIISFCNAEAMTEVIVYQIDQKDFYTLLKDQPEFNLLLLKALSNKVRDTAIRASQQQSHSIAYNLEKLISFSSEESKMLSKQDLADYLGITLRSLNRAMKDIIIH
ncbi:Crp/Fnr family transcriptional regulator [Aquimarina algiphila]|uniref:Crp/Fnr family transcriptional regulator n=1 Tax=Aquimarina algiphila TaxID=2047982 RepID=UPI00232A93E3|nr:Crp/Fnr family transcriptional regulator [Aquimarina algiphila]